MSPSKEFELELIGLLPYLGKYTMSLTRDPSKAEDLVQDTIRRALEKHHLYQPGTNMRSWVTVIARNSFLSGRRRRKFEQEDPDDFLSLSLIAAGNPESQMIATEMLMLVARMPKKFRDALMAAVEGMTSQEIADELGEQVGTMKSRLNRARQMLLSELVTKQKGPRYESSGL